MKLTRSLCLLAALAAPTALSAGYEFEAPVKVKGGDEDITVESPGYAAPGLADVDGDKIPDLLVGQFRSGKISFYKGSKSEDGALTFGEHQWLQADGKPAEVPGVW